MHMLAYKSDLKHNNQKFDFTMGLHIILKMQVGKRLMSNWVYILEMAIPHS